MKAIVGLIVAGMSVFAFAANLHVEAYAPKGNPIFPIATSLIYGDKDAMLVDAQFQKKYAKQVVDMIKKSGKNLKYIYISHSDPDFYFGLDVITKAFPKAKVISTAQTAYLISASKDDKLKVWGDKLKSDAPSKFIVPKAVKTNKIVLDGEDIDIESNPKDPRYSFLWVPSAKTILGGISVFEKSHIWMADTKGIAGINAWIKQIDAMEALKPAKVIPSHFVESDFSPKILDFVKSYLQDFKKAVETNKNAKGIVTEMEKKYPNLPGREALEMGAKVFAGEMKWHIASVYPPIGHVVHVSFDNGAVQFDLHYIDNKTMTFVGTNGKFKGVTDTVEYTAIEVAPHVFMVYWHEPNLGANVVHIQDFNTNTVYTNISNKDGSFIHFKGIISIKK